MTIEPISTRQWQASSTKKFTTEPTRADPEVGLDDLVGGQRREVDCNGCAGQDHGTAPTHQRVVDEPPARPVPRSDL